jgi:hypothetical protein
MTECKVFSSINFRQASPERTIHPLTSKEDYLAENYAQFPVVWMAHFSLYKDDLTFVEDEPPSSSCRLRVPIHPGGVCGPKRQQDIRYQIKTPDD